MLGAIAGDIIGSPYEFSNYKKKDFPLFQSRSKFTDDTVLTVATADVLLNGGDYASAYRKYARMYPSAGYGAMFAKWVADDEAGPYNSFGNGSAMRVSPVGLMFDGPAEVKKVAKETADVTHNHPEGVKGAQAIALATSMAKNGASKDEIKEALTSGESECEYGYDLNRTVFDCREGMRWNATCQGTVGESIVAFLEGEDFEDCIRNAVSIGGDSDTIAAMTGSIAHAYYKKIPDQIMDELIKRLDKNLLRVVIQFEKEVGFDTEIEYSDLD